jgi:hypothetical protein
MHRMLLLLLGMVVLGLTPPASAQTPPSPIWLPVVTEACAHVPGPFNQVWDGAGEAPAVYDRLRALMEHRGNIPMLTVLGARGTARWQHPGFEVRVRPGGTPRVEGRDLEEAWPLAFYTVLVRPLPLPEGPPPEGVTWLDHHRAALARTAPPRPGSTTGPLAAAERGTLALELEFDWPAPEEGRWNWSRLMQRYEVLVLPCLREDAEAPITFASNFGRAEVHLNNPVLGAVAGVAVALLVLGVLGFAARGANAGKLGRGWGRARAWSPAFICQDTFGYMSLSAFQVFLFTLALLGVYTYAFVLTGEPPDVQPSVLALAGITLAGSTLATAANRPMLDTPNRLWLLGTGTLAQHDRQPLWTDMLTTDGHVDITRVQALAFTLFAVTALVVRGAENLGDFTIPEQLNYLIGLSQAVYVAGKALPADTARRLNAEIDALRAAEGRAVAQRTDAAAQAEFDRLKAGAAPLLLDVFGARFNRAALEALAPGGRAALPPAVPQAPIPPPAG